MTLKQTFQFGAAAALLSSGLVVGGAAHACPASSNDGPYKRIATGAAYWGNCANIKCPDPINKLCAQACGTGNTLYAVLSPGTNFVAPGNPYYYLDACVDAFAYSGNNLNGAVEETSFGSSTSTSVTGVPATVQGSLFAVGPFG